MLPHTRNGFMLIWFSRKYPVFSRPFFDFSDQHLEFTNRSFVLHNGPARLILVRVGFYGCEIKFRSYLKRSILHTLAFEHVNPPKDAIGLQIPNRKMVGALIFRVGCTYFYRLQKWQKSGFTLSNWQKVDFFRAPAARNNFLSWGALIFLSKSQIGKRWGAPFLGYLLGGGHLFFAWGASIRGGYLFLSPW